MCQKNYQASSGSNAVVLIGDEATLKQIKIEKDIRSIVNQRSGRCVGFEFSTVLHKAIA